MVDAISNATEVLVSNCSAERLLTFLFFPSLIERSIGDSSMDFLKAIVNRELLATDTASQLPQDLDSLLGPGSYRPTAAKNHRISSIYLQLIEHIVPAYPTILQYRLWHNRLSINCILVDTHDYGKITGITGWDGTQIAPLYKQEMQLPYFHHWVRKADAAYGYEDDEPAWSEDLYDEHFDGSCKLENLSREVLRLNQRPDVLHAQKYQDTSAGSFLEKGERIFDEHQADMANMVIRLQNLWKKKRLPFVRKKSQENAAFPVRLTHRNIRSIRRAMKKWQDGYDIEGHLRACMEDLMPWYGSISHEKYRKSKRKLAKYKKLFVKNG